jgi:hypothetical protein
MPNVPPFGVHLPVLAYCGPRVDEQTRSVGCIIDTPGLRTFRPDADPATLAASFEDVQSLAQRCRFRD